MARCEVCGRLPRDEHCSDCHRAEEWVNRKVPRRSIENPLELRIRRKALGLSAFDVADKIGVTEHSVWAWENRRNAPSAERENEWRKILG